MGNLGKILMALALGAAGAAIAYRVPFLRKIVYGVGTDA